MTTDVLDLTADAASLAEAAGRIARLMPARPSQPALAGVLLGADRQGLLLTATDGELTARARVSATVHVEGSAVVSRRAFAETLAALATPEVRLSVEGSRLAVRTATARFALPRVGGEYPPCAGLPPLVGEVSGADLRQVAPPVAGAASREHALPIFTGVRLRSDGTRIALLATDRYRMAAASVPWRPAAEGARVDALVPAVVLAEMVKQAGRAERVVVHADARMFGLAWAQGSVVVPSLGTPFPDAQLDRLLDIAPECTIEVEADELAGALDRAAPYGGEQSRVVIEARDGILVVRASDPLTGEAEETVKASVRGDHLTRSYQARLLTDALRPFARRTVSMRVQEGMRATAFTAAPDLDLRYLVVPMRTAGEE
ncbi:DNA polymerase III subunit beta [Phytohabitans sp. LJ34]|uniref:DNA polymerase III subunit beta n=1 Tax=Phytohabitans sp. LJ34 TaxID=3452217 RepID=UPI003F8C94CB